MAKHVKKWKEIQEKDEFKNILGIMNRYYSLTNQLQTSKGQIFREKVAQTSNENLKVFLKKFKKYEYLVVSEITDNESKIMDSWIHVDGIAQERIFHKENPSHPVFKIVSLGDLYKKGKAVKNLAS